ncbi:TMEM175 family protein [Paucilactobacillus kaifaensis]|uniref:TMEM175 family protein n=1 Tax=Paucilactobacillus kaifaensis TaxID=2559921 RepID=UPI0010F80E94|nr:TMEM175 family protein [Paucilactobacillus kaifaensis]
MKPDRLQAFSDGVLAILITILVLEFHVPDFSKGHLTSAVLLQWPILMAYIVSFLYVGTLWLFHHDYFSNLTRIDRNLNLINLFVLFTITLVDYPTNLVATAVASGNTDDMKTAFIIYDIVALLISASFELLYWYVKKHPDLKSNQKNIYRSIELDPVRSVIIYGLAIIITPFSLVTGACLLCVGIIFHTFAYLRSSNKL